MGNVRLIARLDVKGPNLIKGIHLEGLRVVGDPSVFASKYYQEGIDELIYMDSVASLYGRNSLSEIVLNTAKKIFVPLTVGGGIRSTKDAENIMRCGADKVAINTAAIQTPSLLSELSRNFGSQSIVLSIEAKKIGVNSWEALTNNGRERTNLNVLEWAKRAVDLGVGEILLTSVDQEGTRKGFDLDLIRAMTEVISIPIIASGGMGKTGDLIKAIEYGHADAIAMADILHYDRVKLSDIRKAALEHGIGVRKYESI
jgi:cyclase